jgi:hypothetical protein
MFFHSVSLIFTNEYCYVTSANSIVLYKIFYWLFQTNLDFEKMMKKGKFFYKFLQISRMTKMKFHKYSEQRDIKRLIEIYSVQKPDVYYQIKSIAEENEMEPIMMINILNFSIDNSKPELLEIILKRMKKKDFYFNNEDFKYIKFMKNYKKPEIQQILLKYTKKHSHIYYKILIELQINTKKDAFPTFEKSKEKNVILDTESYNLLITQLLKDEEMTKVETILAHIKDKKVFLSKNVYSSIIKKYDEREESDELLGLYGYLKENRILLNLDVYTIIINLFIKNEYSNHDLIKIILEEINNNKISQTNENEEINFDMSLIRYYLNYGNIQEATEILKKRKNQKNLESKLFLIEIEWMRNENSLESMLYFQEIQVIYNLKLG